MTIFCRLPWLKLRMPCHCRCTCFSNGKPLLLTRTLSLSAINRKRRKVYVYAALNIKSKTIEKCRSCFKHSRWSPMKNGIHGENVTFTFSWTVSLPVDHYLIERGIVSEMAVKNATQHIYIEKCHGRKAIRFNSSAKYEANKDIEWSKMQQLGKLTWLSNDPFAQKDIKRDMVWLTVCAFVRIWWHTITALVCAIIIKGTAPRPRMCHRTQFPITYHFAWVVCSYNIVAAIMFAPVQILLVESTAHAPRVDSLEINGHKNHDTIMNCIVLRAFHHSAWFGVCIFVLYWIFMAIYCLRWYSNVCTEHIGNTQ